MPVLRGEGSRPLRRLPLPRGPARHRRRPRTHARCRCARHRQRPAVGAGRARAAPRTGFGLPKRRPAEIVLAAMSRRAGCCWSTPTRTTSRSPPAPPWRTTPRQGAQVTLLTCTLGEEGEILVPELAQLAAGAGRPARRLPHRRARRGDARARRARSSLPRRRRPVPRQRHDGQPGQQASARVLAGRQRPGGVRRGGRGRGRGDPRGASAGAGHLRRQRRLRPPGPHHGAPGGHWPRPARRPTRRTATSGPWRSSKIYWTATPRSVLAERLRGASAAGGGRAVRRRPARRARLRRRRRAGHHRGRRDRARRGQAGRAARAPHPGQPCTASSSRSRTSSAARSAGDRALPPGPRRARPGGAAARRPGDGPVRRASLPSRTPSDERPLRTTRRPPAWRRCWTGVAVLCLTAVLAAVLEALLGAALHRRRHRPGRRRCWRAGEQRAAAGTGAPARPDGRCCGACRSPPGCVVIFAFGVGRPAGG